MKVEGSGSLGARIYLFVLLVAIALSSAVIAQVPAQDDSPAELRQRVMELYQQRKYKEAIPLAEKLVVLVKRAKGEEDPDTATSLNNLAALYRAVGDYTKAEPLYKEALEIHQKVLGREHPDTATSLHNLAGQSVRFALRHEGLNTGWIERFLEIPGDCVRNILAESGLNLLQHDTTPPTMENARAIFGSKQRRQFALNASFSK